MPRPPFSARKGIFTGNSSNGEANPSGEALNAPNNGKSLNGLDEKALLPFPPRRTRNKSPNPRIAALGAMQPALFSINSRGEMVQPNLEVPPLTSTSELESARWWFINHLEQLNRPKNTIASYMYDLVGFEDITGSKPLEKINRDDVATFLTNSLKKSTRKRRLTSLGAFFKYLINIEKILEKDPTDNFYSDFVPLKTPLVLNKDEQKALLSAAERENVRTYLMVYFILKLGFTRTELLAIQPEHVNVIDPNHPRVFVYYEDQRIRPVVVYKPPGTTKPAQKYHSFLYVRPGGI